MNPTYFPDFIDSSMLSHFKSCPQKFFFEYIEDWKPKELSVHLHAGASFAKAIETARSAYYTNEHPIGVIQDEKRVWSTVKCEPGNREYAIAAGLQSLMFAYGDFECPADSAKSLERMCGAFEFYWENYALNDTDAFPILLPGGRRGIEFSFSEPLPINNPVTGQPILYCGRFDAILNYGGTILITDEKTTTQLGATWSKKWDLRGQFLGYSWAAQRAGIHVDGALIRGIS
ncbi:MAG: PD-(D/E)XK nuclease family protein, partial [Terriglobia bacterium]